MIAPDKVRIACFRIEWLVARFGILLIAPLHVAAGQSESPHPAGPRGAHEETWKLLAAEQWAEAAEAYGGWFDDLQADVLKALDTANQKPPAQRHLFRYRVLHFFFVQVNFAGGEGSAVEVVENLGPKYVEFARKLPASERGEAPDFSHLDLLKLIHAADADSTLQARDEDWPKIIVALKANPESVPAQVACMFFLHRHWPTADAEADADRTSGQTDPGPHLRPLARS